jgi:S-adenosyl-L-methionine hydrolase (adenosine-forming)
MSQEKQTIIALLTDFGRSDGYDAMMKAVMLSIDHAIQFIDITHDIAPADIRQAAFVLGRSYRFFPDGTIFLVVVDPGVGSQRNILLVSTDRFRFIAPDNGVLQYVLSDNPNAVVRCVTDSRWRFFKVSKTFHGRDIMAPLAAHLAAGIADQDTGPIVDVYQPGLIPATKSFPGGVEGEIIYIDRYGNAITNIPEAALPEAAVVVSLAAREDLVLCSLYQDVAVGEPLALINSDGLLELAVREGNAARLFGASVGEAVRVRC